MFLYPAFFPNIMSFIKCPLIWKLRVLIRELLEVKAVLHSLHILLRIYNLPALHRV